MSTPHFEIEETDRAGRTIATISGMGRNRGTWDTTAKSLSTASRWLRGIRKQYPERRFVITTQFL